MIKDKKYVAVFVLLAVLSTGFLRMFFFSGEAAIVSVPTLFINDRPCEHEKQFPAELINGVEYVPLLFFHSLSLVEHNRTQNENENHFYFVYTRLSNKTFFACNINEQIAYDGNGERYDLKELNLKVELKNGTYYVPATFVSRILGINVEIDQRYNVVRIKTSVATKTLDELIAIYSITETSTTQTTTQKPIESTTETTTEKTTEKPIEPTTETTKRPDTPVYTTAPTVEIPTQTEPPTTTEDITPRENRVIFENFIKEDIRQEENGEIADTIYSSDENLDAVLNILAEYNYKSVFFFDSEGIEKKAALISKIYAEGHEIGIKIRNNLKEETSEPADSHEIIKAELDRTNTLIYALLKNKSRLYILSDDFKGDEFKRSVFEYELKKSGYYLCRDSGAQLRENMTADEILSLLRERSVTTFLFDVKSGSLSSLGLLFTVTDEKDFITAGEINISNITN